MACGYQLRASCAIARETTLERHECGSVARNAAPLLHSSSECGE
jgi:hypothetical protein